MAAPTIASVIDKLDQYFDAAPRNDADPIAVGPFTLFVSRSPWAYYARPAIQHSAAVTPADVALLGEKCAALGVDLQIEWVHQTHPELADVAAAAGLTVARYALMTATPPFAAPSSIGDGTLRVVGADDAAVLAGRGVASVAFRIGGTQVGPAGAEERDRAVQELRPDLVAHLRDRARRGLTVTAVVETAQGVVAVGSYQPVDEIAEILAVATLPVARRQGLAAALTSFLAADASQRGIQLVALSAQSDAVARVYQRSGFRRVGSSCAASRSST